MRYFRLFALSSLLFVPQLSTSFAMEGYECPTQTKVQAGGVPYKNFSEFLKDANIFEKNDLIHLKVTLEGIRKNPLWKLSPYAEPAYCIYKRLLDSDTKEFTENIANLLGNNYELSEEAIRKITNSMFFIALLENNCEKVQVKSLNLIQKLCQRYNQAFNMKNAGLINALDALFKVIFYEAKLFNQESIIEIFYYDIYKCYSHAFWDYVVSYKVVEDKEYAICPEILAYPLSRLYVAHKKFEELLPGLVENHNKKPENVDKQITVEGSRTAANFAAVNRNLKENMFTKFDYIKCQWATIEFKRRYDENKKFVTNEETALDWNEYSSLWLAITEENTLYNLLPE